MAREFESTQARYCSVDSNLGITGPPFWISAWIYKTHEANFSNVWLGDKDAHWNCYMLTFDADERANVYVCENVGTGVRIWTSTSGSINAWHHLCGVFAAADDHRVYLDGGGKNTSSTSISPSGMDRTTVGRLDGTSPGSYTTGSWAEVAFGTGTPTDDEGAALAAGFDPRLVFPRSSIKALWRFLGDDNDLLGNYDLTPYNSPTWSDHLALIYPSSPGGGRVGSRASEIPWHLFFGRAA